MNLQKFLFITTIAVFFVAISESSGEKDANRDLVEAAKRDMWKLRTGKRDPIWKLRTSKKDVGGIWKLRTGKRSNDDALNAYDVFDDEDQDVAEEENDVSDDFVMYAPPKRGADSWKLRTGKRSSAKRENLWHLRAGRK